MRLPRPRLSFTQLVDILRVSVYYFIYVIVNPTTSASPYRYRSCPSPLARSSPCAGGAGALGGARESRRVGRRCGRCGIMGTCVMPWVMGAWPNFWIHSIRAGCTSPAARPPELTCALRTRTALSRMIGLRTLDPARVADRARVPSHSLHTDQSYLLNHVTLTSSVLPAAGGGAGGGGRAGGGAGGASRAA